MKEEAPAGTMFVLTDGAPAPDDAGTLKLRKIGPQARQKKLTASPTIVAATMVAALNFSAGYVFPVLAGIPEPAEAQFTASSLSSTLATLVDDEVDDTVEDIIVAPLPRPVLLAMAGRVLPIVKRGVPLIPAEYLSLSDEEE